MEKVLDEGFAVRGEGEGLQLTRRGIRNFTKDGGAAGSGGVGKIRRAKLPVFVGEQGKGVGFLGVFGDAKLRRGENFNWRKCGGQLGHDKRIVGATAGDDELVDSMLGENEAVERIDNRERGE